MKNKSYWVAAISLSFFCIAGQSKGHLENEEIYFVKIGKITIKWTTVIRTALLILLFGAVVYFYKYFDMDIIKDYIQQNPGRSQVVSLVVFFLASFTFIPTSPLTVFLSISHDPQTAIWLYSLGNTAAAVVQYFIGTNLKDLGKLEQNEAKLPRFLRNLPISSPLFLLVGRIIPGGTRGLSVVCGFYHVRFLTFFWTTTLMFLFSSIFQVFGGIELLKML